jgi:hypothetical protein
MTNKRNRNTSKTLTQDQRALLLGIKPKPFEACINQTRRPQ